MRGKLLQPALKIMVEAGFVVVYKDAGCDVHGIYQAEPFTYAAIFKGLRNLRCDIHKPDTLRNIEEELFAERFHSESIEP